MAGDRPENKRELLVVHLEHDPVPVLLLYKDPNRFTAPDLSIIEICLECTDDSVDHMLHEWGIKHDFLELSNILLDHSKNDTHVCPGYFS